jgi:hypothetical protein
LPFCFLPMTSNMHKKKAARRSLMISNSVLPKLFARKLQSAEQFLKYYSNSRHFSLSLSFFFIFIITSKSFSFLYRRQSVLKCDTDLLAIPGAMCLFSYIPVMNCSVDPHYKHKTCIYWIEPVMLQRKPCSTGPFEGRIGFISTVSLFGYDSIISNT